MALYINELIYKSLKEEEANPVLFQFLYTSIEMLDIDENLAVDFHLWFAVQYTRYLGFFPLDNYDRKTCFFNLKEGIFQSILPDNDDYIEYPLSRYFHTLAYGKAGMETNIAINNMQRRIMIRKITDYYRLHLPGFPELKSPDVLEKILET